MRKWKQLDYIRQEGESAILVLKGRVSSIIIWEGIPLMYASGVKNPADISKWLRKWNIRMSPAQVFQMLLSLKSIEAIGDIDDNSR